MSRPPTIPAEKKLRIVLSVLQGEVTVAEAARREKFSEQAIGNWKRQFLEGGKAGIEAGKSKPSTREGEASVVAERAGLDVGALLDLLGTGLAGSQVLEQKKHAFIAHDHQPSGPARFMVKDLGFAAAEARRSGTATPQLDVLRAVFTDLTKSGLGDQDVATVQACVENLAAP